MSLAAENPKPARKSALGATFKALLRARVTTGLIVVLPIWLTYVLVRFVFSLMRDSSQWVVYWVLHGGWRSYLPAGWGAQFEPWSDADLSKPTVQWAIGIFSVFLTIFILYAVGLFAANIVGRRTIGLYEAVLDRVPLVKTVYKASKQILEMFAGSQTAQFQRVALVPFPSRDTRSIGFITGFSRDARTGEELCTAFIATTPNPTSGFVFVVRRADVIELNWSIEEAIKIVISGGILMPPEVRFGASAAASAVLRAGSETAQSPGAVTPPPASPRP